jgi:hypothetical protein
MRIRAVFSRAGAQDRWGGRTRETNKRRHQLSTRDRTRPPTDVLGRLDAIPREDLRFPSPAPSWPMAAYAGWPVSNGHGTWVSRVS